MAGAYLCIAAALACGIVVAVGPGTRHISYGILVMASWLLWGLVQGVGLDVCMEVCDSHVAPLGPTLGSHVFFYFLGMVGSHVCFGMVGSHVCLGMVGGHVCLGMVGSHVCLGMVGSHVWLGMSG